MYVWISKPISEPTQIFQNSSSCVELIFTDQPNVLINNGVKPSPYENRHHPITYVTFNLKKVYPHQGLV